MPKLKRVYYSNETRAAIRNFPFSVSPVNLAIVRSIVEIKRSAARAARAVKALDGPRAAAIVRACDEILTGRLNDQFVTPSLQGGAGTSLHMNVNEVIASVAEQSLGGKMSIHPNDHVNVGQSTNDVVPSALKIAMIRKTDEVIESAKNFASALRKKAAEFKGVQKLGRTHLQDAVPVTLEFEFLAYAALIERDCRRIMDVRPYLCDLSLGGSAVGNGVNVKPKFKDALYADLRKSLGLPVRPAPNLAAQIMAATDVCMLSSMFVMLALDTSKIASDIRLLSSGPRGGIGELRVKPLQAGSSIMPGKVNPVLLEALNQLYFLVLGNDTTIREAAHGAQLELSVMTPIIVSRLIESGTLLAEVITQATEQCFAFLTADAARCNALLEQSVARATLLTERLGYDEVARIVKVALARNLSIKEVMEEESQDKKKGIK